MDRDGFTLIELLVTLAIAGIVISAGTRTARASTSTTVTPSTSAS